MAIRKRLYHPDEVRAKIRTSQLINRLNSFVQGEIELSPAQVTAALGLIKKTLPDLSAVNLSGTVGLEKPEELNDSVLAHIALNGSARASEAPGGEAESGELH